MRKLIFSIAAAAAIADVVRPCLAEEAPAKDVTTAKEACAPKADPGPTPREIRGWEEGEPIPHGYHPWARPKSALIVAGASTLGSFYVLSAIVGSEGAGKCKTRGCHDASLLFIPLAGPFVRMGVGRNNISSEVMLGLDGVVQLAAASMLYVGMTSTTVVLKRDLATAAPTVTVRPYLGGTSAGFAGSF